MSVVPTLGPVMPGLFMHQISEKEVNLKKKHTDTNQMDLGYSFYFTGHTDGVFLAYALHIRAP